MPKTSLTHRDHLHKTVAKFADTIQASDFEALDEPYAPCCEHEHCRLVTNLTRLSSLLIHEYIWNDPDLPDAAKENEFNGMLDVLIKRLKDMRL